MNNKQRIVIAIGVVIILIMGLFPPWVATLDRNHREYPGDYGLIFSPPDVTDVESGYGVHLDISRLIVQWVTVILVVAGIVLILRDKRNGEI